MPRWQGDRPAAAGGGCSLSDNILHFLDRFCRFCAGSRDSQRAGGRPAGRNEQTPAPHPNVWCIPLAAPATKFRAGLGDALLAGAAARCTTLCGRARVRRVQLPHPPPSPPPSYSATAPSATAPPSQLPGVWH
eukprot:gene23398-biopygen19340